jgi:acetyltransferase-like isoleucine patch superfamily enzyme
MIGKTNHSRKPSMAPPPDRARRSAKRAVAAFAYPLMSKLAEVYKVAAYEHWLERMASHGDDVFFDPTTSIIQYEKLTVGSRVHIGPGAYFVGTIQIGNDVMLGPSVTVQDGYHRFDLVGETIRDSGASERAGIVIEDDAWIGYDTAIMKGVRVGEGSIIGAKSLVMRDVPPYMIAVGSPCRPIKARFSNDQLQEHLRIRGASDERIAAVMAARQPALEALSNGDGPELPT